MVNLDTDLISLVTAYMYYYYNWLSKCKDLTQKMMHTFRKNGFIKGKNAHKRLKSI